MATIYVTASQNINALTYAAGDAIAIAPTTMDRVTLTIDAQVPADVAKIEGTKPLSLSTAGFGTVELKNNSTTQPLIVALSALTGGIWTGARTGVIKARGALMNIGTGTGAAGQTIDLDNFPSSNGAVIDVPQVVFVEESPGGNLIPCFNIHGARNDANGVAYTGTLFKYLSQFGTTPELGNVFEYDEQSKTIYFGHTDGWHVQVTCTAGTTITIGAQYDHNGSRFVVEGVFTSGSAPKYYTLYLRRISGTNPPISSGSYTKFSGTGETTLTATSAIVATGGWLPPNGCAIKINNIHITAVGVPTADSNRATFDIANANFGAYDLEYATFSNRFKFGSGNFFGGTYRFRSVAFPFQFARSGVRDLIDIDGLYLPLDRYVASVGVVITGCGCEAHISNVEAWAGGTGSQTVTVAEMSDLRTLGNLTSRTIDRSVSYNYGLTLRALSGNPDSPLITGTLRSIGNTLNLLKLSNVITGAAQFSDNCTALAQQANAVSFVRFGNGDPCADSVLKNVSVVNGGSVGRSGFYGVGSVANINTAIHTVSIDSKGYGGDLFGGTGFGPRTWVTDVLAVNHPAASTTIPSGNAYGSTKIRFSGVRSDATHTAPWATVAGATYDRCSAKNNITDATAGDVGMCLQYTNGARTAGAIRFGFNSKKLYENLYTVNSAHTEGVDYAFNGGVALYLKSSGVDITFRNVQPLRGVTSMGGPQTGTATSSSGYGSLSMPTGITAQFRMKPCDSATWGSWYSYATSSDLPNFVTAFNAMTGYASDIGFDFEWNIVTTTATASRYLTHLTLDMPVMDPTFTYTEVGFIQVGLNGVEEDAAVAVFNNTTPASPVQYDYATVPVSGEVVFEYPYNFGETPTQIKMVARKPGFDEYVFEGQSWQAGKQVPVTLIPAAAITSATPASITGVTPNGPAKTLTLTAQLVDAYDHSQWWASQEANMIHATPLTSSNGSVFTQPSDWTVISTTLDGSKTLAGGTLQLSTAGAAYAPSLSDLSIMFMAAGSYDMSGATLTGAIHFKTDTGSRIVSVTIPSGVSWTREGTNIAVVAAVNTLIVAANVTLLGAEVRVYDNDNTPAGSYGTELGGEESCPGATFSIPLSAGNNVVIQIIKSGYVEFVQEYTMGSSATFTAVLEVDTYS